MPKFDSQKDADISAEVNLSQLKKCHQRLLAQNNFPGDGLFNPDGVFWRVNSVAASFLGAGRALLLQLAHPWVAQAIIDHSNTFNAPYQRFKNTFQVMYTMIYGHKHQAIDASKRLFVRHQNIKGQLNISGVVNSYYANQPAALFWVLATLWDTSIRCYELLERPLSTDEKQQFYLEGLKLAQLFGLAPETLPKSWLEFEEYFVNMTKSDLLTVSDNAKKVAKFTFTINIFAKPLLQQYAKMTASFLPTSLASAFELPSNDKELERNGLFKLLRFCYRNSPRALRYAPPFREALERIGQQQKFQPLTRIVCLLLVGQTRLLTVKN